MIRNNMSNITSQRCHETPIMIFYEDTDAAGVVYHANFVKFMERARTLFLHDRGLTLKQIGDRYHVQFLVRAINVKFEKPARLEQSLTVMTKITKFGKASLEFSQNIYADPNQPQSIVCSGDVVLVCTNLDFKPCPMPEGLLRELKSES